MKPRTVWETVEVRLTYDELTAVDHITYLANQTRQAVLREAVVLYIKRKAKDWGADG